MGLSAGIDVFRLQVPDDGSAVHGTPYNNSALSDWHTVRPARHVRPRQSLSPRVLIEMAGHDGRKPSVIGRHGISRLHAGLARIASPAARACGYGNTGS